MHTLDRNINPIKDLKKEAFPSFFFVSMDILDKRSCKSTLLQVIEVTAPSLRSNFDARLKKPDFSALEKEF